MTAGPGLAEGRREPGTRGETRRLAPAFLAALALHAAMMAAIGLSRPLTSSGEQEVTIDYAPSAAETPAAADPAERAAGSPAAAPATVVPDEVPSPPATSADPVPPKPPPLDPAPPDRPQESMPPPDRTEVSPDPPPIAAQGPAPQPEPAPKTPAPRRPQPPKPAPETRREATPQPRASSAPRAAETREGARPVPAAPGAEGRSARSAAGAASRSDSSGAVAAGVDSLQRYLARVTAAIQRRVDTRYQDGTRAGATAQLQITLLPSGQVAAAALVRRSGSAELDRIALSAAAPGTALPPFPPELALPRLTFTQVIRFEGD